MEYLIFPPGSPLPDTPLPKVTFSTTQQGRHVGNRKDTGFPLGFRAPAASFVYAPSKAYNIRRTSLNSSSRCSGLVGDSSMSNHR